MRISARQIAYFLQREESDSFIALRYLLGECNYGGRITDENDRILMKTLIEDFFSEDIVSPDFKIGNQKDYKVSSFNIFINLFYMYLFF